MPVNCKYEMSSKKFIADGVLELSVQVRENALTENIWVGIFDGQVFYPV